MGDREVPDELSMERVEKESGVALEERVFTVGEVVEYWEGAFVRGERLGSGEPAFVKRVEGQGQYAIKMVGASRGKFRICGWTSLFKDGSFNKNVLRSSFFFPISSFLFLLSSLSFLLCPLSFLLSYFFVLLSFFFFLSLVFFLFISILSCHSSVMSCLVIPCCQS